MQGGWTSLNRVNLQNSELGVWRLLEICFLSCLARMFAGGVLRINK